MDEVSRRLTLLVPGVLGADRVDERLPVNVQPVADVSDLDVSNIIPSNYPVREARWPVALVSQDEQYGEWSDSNSARKHEFERLTAGDASSPGLPPEQYGSWLSYDEYRLAIGIAPRGSYATDAYTD